MAVVAMTLPATALASAGSGTSGYGGGGGVLQGLGALAYALLFIVAAPFMAVSALLYRRRRRKRQRRVVAAAAEAATEDPVFAPDRVRYQGEHLFRSVQNAWSRRDRERLAQLVGPDLMVEWNRRLNDFERRGWRNHVKVLGNVEVDYVELINRPADHDDRVVVWIKANVRDIVTNSRGHQIRRNGSTSDVRLLEEYWTLAKREGAHDDQRGETPSGSRNRHTWLSDWVVLSIEQDREGRHELKEAIVATPAADTERLHEQAVAELAAVEKVPPGFEVAEAASVELEGEARQAALDLSLADGRFAPQLLEAEVRRVVAAWAQAVDGDDRDLEALARPNIRDELLCDGDPSHSRRLVIRGPQVRALRITSIDGAERPPRVTIDFEVYGVRYVEDRDTAALLSGNQSAASRSAESWVLGLEGDDAHPWRLIKTGAAHPAAPVTR